MSGGEVLQTEGGFVGFRAFAHDPGARGLLQSLGRHYEWEPGEQEADALPTVDNFSGFYAFKTYTEATYQAGEVDEFVFALTEHWGKIVEGEWGLRSQFAEIKAFIEPTRAKAKAAFPYESLAEFYPEVPVVHQRRIAAIIEYCGMVSLPRSAPAPYMQWLTEKGLVWAPEGVGPVGVGRESDVDAQHPPVMLEAAVIYPDEMHPVDHRMMKARVSSPAREGASYVIWTLPGAHGAPEVREFIDLVRYGGGERMLRHSETKEGESNA